MSQTSPNHTLFDSFKKLEDVTSVNKKLPINIIFNHDSINSQFLLLFCETKLF